MSPAVTEVAVGSVSEWPWAAATIPSWSILPYGQAISRTTYVALANLAAQSGYAYGNGDGSTTFGVPDFRGRTAIGKDDMGGVAAGRLTVAISGIAGTSLGAVGGAEGITLTTGQIPAHNHGITDNWHTHTISDPNHAHGVNDPGHTHGMDGRGFTDANPGDVGAGGQHTSALGPGVIANGGLANHNHGISGAGTGIGIAGAGTGIGIYAAATGITINNAGGGVSHPNVPPIVVVNKIMRAV
jgi:microcystin-dependent protein